MSDLVVFFSNILVKGFAPYLMPITIVGFVFGIAARFLVYWTVKRESWFTQQFEKRVFRFLDGEKVIDNRPLSFQVTVKRILERTYYELFEYRAILKRRKSDAITTMGDRVFLIQMGAAKIVRDTLKLIKHFKYGKSSQRPKFLEVSKTVFQGNPCFTKVFGIFPVGVLNDVVNILPGLFIVGGIFGTFLGIMQALPELRRVDVSDLEMTKVVMDNFLVAIAFSMNTSIIGIVFSVAMTVFNTFIVPDKLFLDAVDKYEGCLDILWNRCNNNKLPEQIEAFNEHKDPLDALAEEAVRNQLKKGGSRFAEDDTVRDSPIVVEEVDGEDEEISCEMEYDEEEDDDETNDETNYDKKKAS